MKYRLTVLTPTLVGDGTKLSPIDYMVWRDQVNVLDQTRIFRLLAKGPRLEGYLQQLRKATRLDFHSWGGFAQNYAGRRIPFEDAAYTPVWNAAPVESLSIPAFASTEAGPFIPGAALKGALRTALVFAKTRPTDLKDFIVPRRPGEQLEQETVGRGGSDRLRAISISDSASRTRDTFKVFLLRVSTLSSKAPEQYTLGWKPTPTFAEMAEAGTSFEGGWRENEFLNGDEIRKVLRWNRPVTHKVLFEAANEYAAKQLELHERYAKWTGLEALSTSVANLQQKLNAAKESGRCLLALGWGAGFLSKSAAIGTDEADHRKVLSTLPFYQRAINSGLPFPKTRRVVFLKNKPAALPGWVELAIDA